MRKRKRQAVKKLIQCAAVIAAGVLAIILFMLAIWYRGKNSEPVTDEQVAAQMQQAEPLVIETPEAATEGSIRVYDYDGCCIYSYYGKIRINSDGKDDKEIDVEAFWREEEETKEDIASWVAAWHFPCVIEKDSTKSMIYGYRAESVIVDCYNEGDVSTGMRIRFTALGTVSNPILLNVDTEEFIQINATMKTGDVIEINTKYGSKGAKLIRDGVETDYFRYIDVDSTFMQLAIGDNMFRYDAASGVNSLEVSIFYSKEFLGV